MLILLCAVILFIIIVHFTYTLPKIVWTHWDSRAGMPEFCRLNLERTRRILHDWDVRFFTDSDFLQWCPTVPDGFDKLSKQHRADFMRLWLLKKHGGVWMDIGIVLNTSITPLVEECRAAKAELSGFYIEGTTTDMKYPVFENWFIMAPQGSRIINLWYEEYVTAIRQGFNKYKENVRATGVHFHKLLKDDGDVYLTQHLCFQVVIQRRVWLTPNILYKRAEDTMFRIHGKCKWNRECMKSMFKSSIVNDIPYIKLCGGERKLFPITYFYENYIPKVEKDVLSTGIDSESGDAAMR